MRVSKMLKQIALLGLAICLCAPIHAFGQTAESKTGDPKTGDAKPSDASVQSDYLLGVEDIIEVTVQNHADLNRVATVLPGGIVTIPPIGDIHAGGMTTHDLAAIIQKGLEKTYNNCPVLVGVKEIHSRRIRILGAVHSPGMFDLKPNWRLVDLIAAANGLAIRPEHIVGKVVRQGSDRVQIDIVKAMSDPETDANFKLEADDLVMLDEKPMGQVYVMGQVNKPGTYDLTDSATMLSILSEAGNPTETAALTKAYILHNGTQTPINLRTILVKGSDDDNLLKLTLQPDDLLFIPEIEERYSVMGQITKPGTYAIPDTGERTVLQALNISGGVASGGDLSQVSVIRTTDGKTGVIKVNAEKLLKTGNLSQDIPIKSGDIVYVPSHHQGRSFNWQDLITPISILNLLGFHL